MPFSPSRRAVSSHPTTKEGCEDKLNNLPRLIRWACAIFGLLLLGMQPALAQTTITDACIENLAGFDLGCTANDVGIAQATDIHILDDGCSYPGDTVTFAAVFEVELNATERHDIGLYFANDGDPNKDGAITGTCTISTVPYQPEPAWVDLDGTNDDPNGTTQDTCGDINDTHNPLTPVIEVTAVCIDTDNDGKLNLPYCTSWRQPGKNELCTSPLDAIPGGPSKCKCDVGFNVDIDVPPAELRVEKIALPDSISEPGGSVAFEVRVTNISPFAAVTLNQLVDDEDNDGIDDIAYDDLSDICDTTFLAPEASTTCSFTRDLLGNAGDILVDRVTVSGTDANDNFIEGSATAQVTITDIPSSIQVQKSVLPTSMDEPGGAVTYTIIVTNTSLVDTVILNTVYDAALGGDISGVCDAALPVTLAPGEFLTCMVDSSVWGEPGAKIPNTATAAGIDDDGNPVADNDDAFVSILDVEPSIFVEKTVVPDTVPEPGQDVTYTVTVTNTSAVDTVTIDTVDDPDLGGDISAFCNPAPPAALAPGESLTCTVPSFVEGNAGDVVPNTASASGTDDDGADVFDKASADVAITDVPSSIQVIKTANPTSVDEPGGDVTYTVEVFNTSPADDVTIETVTDPMMGGDISGSCDQTVPATLPPGAILTCTVVHAVSGNAGDIVPNTASATGTDDDGNPVSDNDDESVTISDVPSSIDVTKSATPTSVPETGGEVFYTITVLNTSAVDTVTITSVDDDVFGEVTNCTPSLPADLAPGAGLTCSFSMVLSGNANQTHTNVVSVEGRDDDLQLLRENDDETVRFDDVLPDISITKDASPGVVPETGGEVTFNFTVINNSAEAATLNTLEDSVFGDLNGKGTCSVPQPLAANGGAYSCAYTTTIEGDYSGPDHVNVVTATASDDEGNTDTASDDARVDFSDVLPRKSIVKTANPTAVPETGGDVEFTITVTNEGLEEVTLSAFTDSVYDLAAHCPDAIGTVLSAGASYTCTFTEFVAGDFSGPAHHNVAMALVRDNEGNTAGGEDDAVVTFINVPPQIQVTKDTEQYVFIDNLLLPGTSTATYEVEVTNLSPETVWVTSLLDDMFGDLTNVALQDSTTCTVPQELAPGQSYQCSFDHTFSNLEVGYSHENWVTASAVDNDTLDPATDADNAWFGVVQGPGNYTHGYWRNHYPDGWPTYSGILLQGDGIIIGYTNSTVLADGETYGGDDYKIVFGYTSDPGLKGKDAPQTLTINDTGFAGLTIYGYAWDSAEIMRIMTEPVKGDKTYTAGMTLASAVMNLALGNPITCVRWEDGYVYDMTDYFLVLAKFLTHDAVGSRVKGRDWNTDMALGDSLISPKTAQQWLDDYNNGRIGSCIHHP